MAQTPPMQMTIKLVRLLRAERPDYLDKIFQIEGALLVVKPARARNGSSRRP